MLSTRVNESDASFIIIFIFLLCLSFFHRKIANIIRELIQVEKNYVEKLARGIEVYVKGFDDCVDLPVTLRGKKYHIFGNIERIHDFHHDSLLPALIECDENVQEMANVFKDYIEKDRFYGYVLYGLNKPKAEHLTLKHKDFFEAIANKSIDKLGINSFLLEPIQRLPRYSLLFNEIIKVSCDNLTLKIVLI